MGSFLESVRRPLLEEARQSPNLLSDLAGLESYVAESYDARSFIELLQNADDADARRFLVRRVGEFLLVANDGHVFSEQEFASLCRSASSSKTRGSAIGYRGIGFKSVVGLAGEVHIFSDGLAASFSRELTRQEVLQADRVPLVRIPHPTPREIELALDEPVSALRAEGFRTFFAFSILRAGSIENEFASFDPATVLFLRNVVQVTLEGAVPTIILRSPAGASDGVETIDIEDRTGKARWLVTGEDARLAFLSREGRVGQLPEREAVVHAFLPTHEPTGFAFRVNADVDTDPSRTKIVLNEKTAAATRGIAREFVKLLEPTLLGKGLFGTALARGLSPVADPRMAALQRPAFRHNLVAAIKSAAQDRFRRWRLRPDWIPATDFHELARRNCLTIAPELDDDLGIRQLLGFLGAREATLEELLAWSQTADVTTAGAAALIGRSASACDTGGLSLKAFPSNSKLWITEQGMLAASELATSLSKLDQGFVDSVTERAGSPDSLVRFLTKVTSPAIASRVVDLESHPGHPVSLPVNESRPVVRSASLKRWRTAEMQVADVLRDRRWQVEDVTRSNVGYDLDCVNEQGESIAVEVKHVKSLGEPFTLTSNEEVVARQRGFSYCLAIVADAGTHLAIAFIYNPTADLLLIRQCRQWVWECSAYKAAPELFAYGD